MNHTHLLWLRMSTVDFIQFQYNYTALDVPSQVYPPNIKNVSSVSAYRNCSPLMSTTSAGWYKSHVSNILKKYKTICNLYLLLVS